MSARALVFTGFGINCEEETAAAFRLAGGKARVAHLNDVFGERISIHDFDVIAFPGGFSFGDDLGSGKVLANKLTHKRTSSGRRFLDEIERFLGDGKLIIGICNGFQVLVKTGLLPGLTRSRRQQITLTRNDSGRFEDRWVRCRTAGAGNRPFLRGMDSVELPVRHGEGRLVIREPEVREAIRDQGLGCLVYVDETGAATGDYPANPNGSDLHLAGLSDPTGQIFGLMPHPEAYLTEYNHPAWTRRRRLDPTRSEEGEGLEVFRNAVRWIQGRRD